MSSGDNRKVQREHAETQNATICQQRLWWGVGLGRDIGAQVKGTDLRGIPSCIGSFANASHVNSLVRDQAAQCRTCTCSVAGD
jgi:hypothetical protein